MLPEWTKNPPATGSTAGTLLLHSGLLVPDLWRLHLSSSQQKQKDTAAGLLGEQTVLGRGPGTLADTSPGLHGKHPTQVCDLLAGSFLGVESMGYQFLDLLG